MDVPLVSRGLSRRRLISGALGAFAGAAWGVHAWSAGALAQSVGEALRTLDETATDLDRTHLPIVSLPARPRLGRAFDLVVRVGDPMHEQRRDHHIAWLEVHYGTERLFRSDLSADVPYPVVRVPVVLRRADVLSVSLGCTRHGGFVWRRALEPT